MACHAGVLLPCKAHEQKWCLGFNISSPTLLACLNMDSKPLVLPTTPIVWHRMLTAGLCRCVLYRRSRRITCSLADTG